MSSKAARYIFKVRSYEADYNNRLKISSVFNFMQIAAGLNANELKFGYDQLTPQGLFWVLSRVVLEWNGNIHFDEDVIIETWPSGVEKLFATRDFKILDSAGNIIGKAKTAWLVMDEKTARPVFLDKVSFPLPNFDIQPAIEKMPGKIAEPAEKLSLGSRCAVYADIDVNQHVNNAKYIEYVYDAIPESLRLHTGSIRLQINYLKELKINDTFEIFYAAPAAGATYHYLDAHNLQDQKVFQCAIWVGE
jgi:medium-chain acyl-[acyl-carrier-protein] hydrolase